LGKSLFALFFYYGIQPTLFFIPLIFQLYLTYPLLHLLSNKFIKTAENKEGSGVGGGLVILLLLFALHITIGYLSYSGKIFYYTFCRPFFLFWLFYFFAGMYFRRIRVKLSLENYWKLVMPVLVLALVALSVWNAHGLLDTSRVGLSFERNATDMAYSRPEIMPYNIVWVLIIGILLSLSWSFRSIILELLGKFSYHIYLWHLLVLSFYVWGNPLVMGACRESPAVILLVIVLVCAAIAVPGQCLAVTLRFIRSLIAGFRGATAREERSGERNGR
jgi:peptidoglycan/LPS O-acetylase OafA/YrhL